MGVKQHSHQEDAARVTAEISSDEEQSDTTESSGATTSRSHVVVAVILLLIGIAGAAMAALQLAMPDLGSGIAFLSYGRLAPASRVILIEGWSFVGLLGVSYFAITRITGGPVKRQIIAMVSLGFIALGSVLGAVGILIGLGSGISGQDAPIWARVIVAIGLVLATLSISATAKVNGDKLGAAGWYLVAAPIMIMLTSLVGLVPPLDGIAGLLQSSFVNAGVAGFIITASVGMIYFVFGSISGRDSGETRPLAALGFWSLILVWSFMSGTDLIHSAAPNWLGSIAVAFAIAAFVPAIAIATDIGLMVRGSVASIRDRASLRFATVAAAALATGTAVNVLLTFPASSAIAQFTLWAPGLDALVVLGGASFAIFAGHSVMTGGSERAPNFHFSASTVGLILVGAGTLAGGVATGFSWAAGPTSRKFPNWGPGWEVTANTVEPFIWMAAAGLVLFAVGQIAFAIGAFGTHDETLQAPDDARQYDLEFSGDPKYLTWKRLVGGVTVVWIAAALFTLAIPVADIQSGDATLLADTSRVYPADSSELAGRDLYIAEGCVQCHTQEVRAVAADVGLGPVSVAGDYANEDPILRGAVRIGPDLFHAASREGFSAEGVKALLTSPGTGRSWSIMPSYSYLSDADIDALVSYIETLR